MFFFGILILAPIFPAIHISDNATSIPPDDISWTELTNLFEIRSWIVNPLFFSLNKLTSGGGPSFIPTTSLKNSLW
jgi:hypothetical protein